MAGLHYLKHAFGLSDEAVVKGWVENPYWQYFCGEEYFQRRLPIDPSQMTRFRTRLGPSGCEKLLELTITAGLATQTVKPASFRQVTLDTTVQEKAIAFPTDGRLYHKGRVWRVRLARHSGIELRQSYVRKGKQALFMQQRYAAARQMRRARRELKRPKVYLGRVYRDILRKLPQQSAAVQERFAGPLAQVVRLLAQQRHDHNKLYSLHAPEVECIAKGKAHKKYEFGIKVSLAVTQRDNFIVGAWHCPAIRSMATYYTPRYARSNGSRAPHPNAAMSIAATEATGSKIPACTLPAKSAASPEHCAARSSAATPSNPSSDTPNTMA